MVMLIVVMVNLSLVCSVVCVVSLVVSDIKGMVLVFEVIECVIFDCKLVCVVLFVNCEWFVIFN